MRRNCAACSRWRPITDYGAAESRLVVVCVPCRRRHARGERAERISARSQAQRAAYAKRRQAVERGDELWITAPFVRWLTDKAAEHGWDLMVEWSGVSDERVLRFWLDPTRMTVPLDVVDRLLLWEGTSRLEDFWPLTLPV